MEHTTAADNPFISSSLHVAHTQGEVLLQLLLEPFSDMTARTVLAFTAKERRIVDCEEHTHSRLIDRDGRQRLRVFEVGNGVTNLELLKTYHRTDVTTLHHIGTTVTDALKSMKLLNLRLFLGAIAVTDSDVHAVTQHTAMHAAHRDAPGIVAVIERCNEHLRRPLQMLGSRYHLKNLVKQVIYVVSGRLPVRSHPAILSRAVNHGEVELLFGSIEVTHQVEYHLVDLLRPAVRLVHLIDHNNGLEANLERLLQHESGLRHRAFEGIDEQQASIGHIEHSLHLATEVRVTGSIQNINLDTFPPDGNVLGKNGYPSLSLQIIGIKHFAAVVLSIPEKLTSEHHLVNQSSLTMIDVRNYCDVPNVLHCYITK